MSGDVFVQLIYALCIGVLIGLERSLGIVGEHQTEGCDSPKNEGPTDDFPGIRTFAVLSLVGFAAAIVSEKYDFVAPVVLVSVAILVVAMYVTQKEFGTGITTEAAAIGTCALGMLCRVNHSIAGVLALVLTVLLALKPFTRTAITKVRRVELTDTLKFLAVILILLPLLPNRALDPWGALNPYKVGVLVVLISGISFVGYFLTRILGAQKGLGLTGALGGLTSSTAVTAAMAAEAKAHPELRSVCAFSTVIANATMFARVLVVVALLDRLLVQSLLWPVGAMALVAALAAAVLWVSASKSEKLAPGKGFEIEHKNPFSLSPALKFAGFFVAIIFVAKLATTYFGDRGLYIAAALSGLADVDAITLSITEQTVSGELARNIGAIGITIAVVSNSIVKTCIAFYSGGWVFGRLVALCLGIATAAGLVVAFSL